jgi:transposase-like protein
VLEIPNLRRGSYLPCFLEPYLAAEEALVAMIQEACVQGVSTRMPVEMVEQYGRHADRKASGQAVFRELRGRTDDTTVKHWKRGNQNGDFAGT